MLPTLLALVLIVSNGSGVTGVTPPHHSRRGPSHSSSPHARGRTGANAATDHHSPSPRSRSSTAGGGSPPAPGPTGNRLEPAGGGSAPSTGPVAYFVATSPVAPGMPVSYTDESYDTVPGAQIVQTAWRGRALSFSSPGVYTVTLTVTDSQGHRSSYSTQILVSGSTASPPSGRPAAFFLVTSPVAAGAPVTFTDESYDLDPGAHIVDEQWSGRQGTYAEPGTYAVALRVEDSTGAWSPPFTRGVVVVPAALRTHASGPTETLPPVTATWTADALPNPATPGTLVTVTATPSASVGSPPTLVVPQSLQGTWNNTSYAAVNASGAMTSEADGSFARTLEVPDSAAFPAGTYVLTIEPPGGAQPVTVALVVQPVAAYIEAIVSGT